MCISALKLPAVRLLKNPWAFVLIPSKRKKRGELQKKCEQPKKGGTEEVSGLLVGEAGRIPAFNAARNLFCNLKPPILSGASLDTAGSIHPETGRNYLVKLG